MRTYDDAILAYLDVIPDSGSLDDGVGTDVNVVAYFHRVVVEVASICFVRRPRIGSQDWSQSPIGVKWDKKNEVKAR